MPRKIGSSKKIEITDAQPNLVQPQDPSESILMELVKKNINLEDLPAEIDIIERNHLPREGRSIIKSLLDTPYIFSGGFSSALFKTCLDKLLSNGVNQKELIQTLTICKSKLNYSIINNDKNIDFKEMMIYFLYKTEALTAPAPFTNTF